MKISVLVIVAMAGLSQTAPARAGLIGQACVQINQSPRGQKLCICIDKVAQASLTDSERQQVATFFGDPHKTQIIRASDDSGDEIFWERYKAFGERARKLCR